MTLQLPARLIELFGRFRQLNSILDENWRDVSSKDFFSNYINPVNLGWRTFDRQFQEASETIKRIDSSVESSEFEFQRFMNNLDGLLHESRLIGYQHYTVHLDYEDIDVLVPDNYAWNSPGRGTKDCLRDYLSLSIPGIDEDTRIEAHGGLGIT